MKNITKHAMPVSSSPLISNNMLLQLRGLPLSRPTALVLVLLISACNSGGSTGLVEPPTEQESAETTDQQPEITNTDNGETPGPSMDEVEVVEQPTDQESTETAVQQPTATVPDNVETPGPSMDDVDIVDVADPTQCNQATQNQWAYNAMQDFYLFYDQVPVVDPQAYASADALVRDVRFEERDEFSTVSNAEQENLLFEAGREFGLGFGLEYDQADTPRVSYLYTNSPMGRAGIERGDIVVSVNGVAWFDALGPDLFDAIVGTPENPATTNWQFQKANTAERVDVEVTSTEYAINTVLSRQIISNESLGISAGYLVFNSFLPTSQPELIEAFDFFRVNNVTDLILDLRYNRGGLLLTALQLASAIGGESLAGQPVTEIRYNDKYSDSNVLFGFISGVGDLNLTRLIVLTSEQTASASEMVIAGLQPYMDVVTVGTRTTGKAYGSNAIVRCDEQLNIMEFEWFNVAGISVFGGIPATCYAADDLSNGFGLSSTNIIEGQLLAGLNYLEDGSCPTAPVISAARQTDRSSTREEHMHFRYGLPAVKGVILE